MARQIEDAKLAKILFSRNLAAGLAFATSLFLTGPTYGQTSEPWVIVGFVTHPAYEWTDKISVVAKRTENLLKPCGLTVFWDYSGKFSGFNPNGTVLVVDGHASMTMSQAKRLLAIARKCIPDAYIKRGVYSGE